MKHVFIIDPKSFHGQQWRMDALLDSIGQYFRTHEKTDFSTVVIKYSREAIGLIQKQVDAASEGETVRVYAIGGDTILFDCLNGIAGLPNMELAVMPFGMENSFIRSFGEGKAKFFLDIHTLAGAPVIPTDIIEVGHNYAINGCSVGLIPAVEKKIKAINTQPAKGLNRFSAALWRFMVNLSVIFDRGIVARRYNITIEGIDYSGNYSLVMIANVPYFGRKKIPLAGAMPNDGLLDVVLFRPIGIFSTWWSYLRYTRGKIPFNCIRLQAKKIAIQSEKPMWIQTDSEYFLDTNITFNVLPGAVQFVAANNMTYQRY